MSSMSSSPWTAEKLNPSEPSAGSSVTTGFTRRESKTFSAVSLALNIGEARSSWIARARWDANRSFVGVFIRSTSATSTPFRTSSWEARRTRDDLP